jgi:threonine dehydrogenase-like Zn-dependent dehydrogenase
MGSSSCGTCRACLRGQDKGCAEHFLNFSLKGGSYGPGGFAEYKIHRSDGVFPVGDAPWDQAALAEPLSCAIHAARLLDARLGDTAVVFGAGTMGLLNLMVLKKSGLRVAVVDVNEGRLAKATSLGADVILKAGPDIRDRVKAAFLGGVDFSIAAYGSEEVNQDALDVLNNRGKICLFASAHPVTPFAIDPNLMHNRETSAVGVVSADRRDHAVATDLIATGQIDLSPIVDATFPLVEAAAAFERATSSPSYRVMLHP